MSIDSGFPKADDLKDIEIKTLRFLNDCKEINQEEGFSLFLIAVRNCYSKLGFGKRALRNPVNFHGSFNLQISDKWKRFHVGSIIQNDCSQVSYYLSICEVEDSSSSSSCTILRKFHFDYDNGAIVSRQAHPRFHFQYGGELTPGMCAVCTTYDSVMQPSLSEPRLSCAPMSIALLLNCVFIEFKTEITNAISENKEWREIVKINEKKLLEPYYRECKDFFNVGKHSPYRLFTSEYCYGK